MTKWTSRDEKTGDVFATFEKGADGAITVSPPEAVNQRVPDTEQPTSLEAMLEWQRRRGRIVTKE